MPLVNSHPDEPLLLELRYTCSRATAAASICPISPPSRPCRKVYLCVYLPMDRVLLGKSGPWTDELDRGLAADSGFPGQDGARAAKKPFCEWVLGDRAIPGGSPAERFHTDGKLYVFSTLQPEAPPKGSLHLCFLNAGWFNGLLLGGVVFLGVLLVPAPGRTRVLAIGLAVIALAVCALFWPLAARELMGWRFWDVALIVAVVWAAWWCGWAVPRDRKGMAARPGHRDPRRRPSKRPKTQEPALAGDQARGSPGRQRRRGEP